MKKNNRVAVVYIDPKLIITLLTMKGTFRVVNSVIPKDAQCLGVNYLPERAGFGMTITSKTFKPLTAGELIPVLENVYFEVTPDKNTKDSK